ncbi:MAG: FtsQ-type POTRA domain-containing protein [Candidatus Bipolaricaulota bacterium]|nr:FtsQ-type POTRA domain-containing protein [Candidatus Bipolaricaulota bacterium]MCS7274444.1 FtsQ-type POTRA domain-containing protein [Candidatus Bipolaricaulota bacterium]MDW8110873.1 FtsQ-type POTRA domain-containing protein [Candidatus Bipolaricaulota bacterium]MDW8328646.1 FtsQ-type POTRA domain-containing protein [Candidatus Bipolaricaulota bacterium]
MRRWILVLALVGIFFLPWREYIAIREIVVEGGERIQTDRVLQRLPFQRGAPWWTADLAAAERLLLEWPEVKAVRVQRVWWGGIRVLLQEREPWAMVRLPDGTLHWSDDEGFLFARAPAMLFGPVFSGVEATPTERGLRLADPFYLVPMRAILQAPGRFLHRISSVRFAGREAVISLRDGPELWVSVYDLYRAWERWEAIMAALPHARALDLRWSGIAIVRSGRTNE